MKEENTLVKNPFAAVFVVKDFLFRVSVKIVKLNILDKRNINAPFVEKVLHMLLL